MIQSRPFCKIFAVPSQWPRDLRALQRAVMHAVEIGKDTILVFQHRLLPLIVAARTPDLIGDHKRPDQSTDGGKINQKDVARGPPHLTADPLRRHPQHHRRRDNQTSGPALAGKMCVRWRPVMSQFAFRSVHVAVFDAF